MWLRVDDRFLRHPKIWALSKEAKLLHLAGLLFAAEHLTDGVVTSGQLSLVAAAVPVSPGRIKELVSGGLWDVTTDGWLIHDFLEYNPSREVVMEKRRMAAEKGRRGADSRWHGRSHSGEHDSLNGPVPSRPEGSINLPAVPGESPDEPWFQARVRGIDDHHLYLLRKLYAWDRGWADLTLGGFLKIRGKHGGAILTMALQHAWEDKPKILAGPYPLLEAICQTIRAKGES